MASTIVTKNSSTASAVPVSGDLTQGELAVNVTDKKLYTKNASGTVVELGTTPTSLTTGAISGTTLAASGAVTFSGGTANGVAYLNGSKVVTTGLALTFDGTNFATTGTISGTNHIVTGGSASGNSMYLATTNAIGWSTNGTERMRVDASGNLGLGVTPSAWSGSYKVFQFGGRGAVWSASDTSAFSHNFYNDGTGNKRIAADYATLYQQQLGQHQWLTAGSSTAGSAVSFTQAMTLDASGNLGIGITSIPSYNANLRTVSFNNTNGVVHDYCVNGTRTGSIVCQSGSFDFSTQTASCPVTFSTNGTERARIDSSGNLLVGATTKPLTNLRMYVQGADTSSTAYAFMAGDSSQNTLLYIRNDGLYVTGTQGSSPYNNTTASAANMVVTSTGQLQRSTSSLKYKTNVQDSVHGLSDLLKLRSVTYEGRAETDAGKTFGGLIAEEVDAAGLTEFVQYAEDGSPDALAYGNMVSLCIKAIQEQQALIQQLQADVAALKGN